MKKNFLAISLMPLLTLTACDSITQVRVSENKFWDKVQEIEEHHYEYMIASLNLHYKLHKRNKIDATKPQIDFKDVYFKINYDSSEMYPGESPLEFYYSFKYDSEKSQTNLDSNEIYSFFEHFPYRGGSKFHLSNLKNDPEYIYFGGGETIRHYVSPFSIKTKYEYGKMKYIFDQYGYPTYIYERHPSEYYGDVDIEFTYKIRYE